MPSRRRLQMWSLGLVPLILILAVLTVGWLRGGARDQVDQSQPGPVLLVAGYGGSTTALQTLAAALRSRGRDAVIVPATGTNTGDLEEQASTLNGIAQQRLGAGAPSVDVVGYSAGGVVARIWADGAGADVTRRIVTLGSPHHGTDVAGAAARLATQSCPRACQQLAPSSSLLDDLPETPSGARWVSIYTANDETVIPVTTARLQGAINIELQQVCTGTHVTHGQLPQDSLTIGLVERALDGPPLSTAPGPGQCAALRAQG